MTTKACKKSERKHTPITSKKEQGLFGAAYGAKKKGKKKPSYVPSSLWGQPMAILKMHLKETKGKKLPKKVRRKKK
jgi:hypothetical protein